MSNKPWLWFTAPHGTGATEPKRRSVDSAAERKGRLADECESSIDLQIVEKFPARRMPGGWDFSHCKEIRGFHESPPGLIGLVCGGWILPRRDWQGECCGLI